MIKEWTAAERADIYAPALVMECPTCNEAMGAPGYPLWGMHLQAVLALHAAHRAVTELRDVPGVSDTERRFYGARLVKEVPR